jgi:heptose I phosphotransferase
MVGQVLNVTDIMSIFPTEKSLHESCDGTMWFDARYHGELEDAGLSDFDAVMTNRNGYCLRALRDRENWRFELHDAQGPRGVFLKRHHVRTWWSWLRAKLGMGPGETPGRLEVRNVDRLVHAGIDVMEVLAFGERLHEDGRMESFLLTHALEGYVELQHFLRRRFPPRDPCCIRPTDPELGRLLDQMADIVRRFHEAGFNHRDLYCCHFFVREPDRGRFEIRMIDLQRVQHRCRGRWRWIIKDLAQLAWSVPHDRVSCTQRLAFMRRYLGVSRLGVNEKRLIRAVVAKQFRMERRLGPSR